MQRDKVYQALSLHVPTAAVEYCTTLWDQAPFQFRLTKSRQTKVGDFSCLPNRPPRITVNEDLNPYLFLTTYVHEVAHLRVYLRHRNQVDPHGTEWKETFQELLQPLLLQESVYPETILHALRLHMVDPKASSFSDPVLTEVFRTFDTHYHSQQRVQDVPPGSIFKLNGRYFQKGKHRRTRVLCKEMKSKRLYLVPMDALVSDVQLSLL
jgi:hypothetical protein